MVPVVGCKSISVQGPLVPDVATAVYLQKRKKNRVTHSEEEAQKKKGNLQFNSSRPRKLKPGSSSPLPYIKGLKPPNYYPPHIPEEDGFTYEHRTWKPRSNKATSLPLNKKSPLPPSELPAALSERLF